VAKQTDAQRNAANDAARGAPPAYEQVPLSEKEQRLIERAQERQLDAQREGRS